MSEKASSPQSPSERPSEKPPEKSQDKRSEKPHEPAPIKLKEAELFQKFIVNKKILIADESASSRSGIFTAFSKLGVKPFQISLASTLADAEVEVIQRKPDIVIAEYNFGKHCGLDLLQRQREKNPDVKKTIFILLTSNSSQTAVARAAEEDVDAFILKPFTAEVLRNSLIRAALMKAHPPEYVKKIDEGKAKLAAGEVDAAEAIFKEAVKLDAQPSLAHYYIGQILFLRKIIDPSRDCYETGLGFNKIHYKCMVGLYELLMELKLHKEAYDVVKRISQYFPANPKRLAEVLRLAIINKSYEDVERYYVTFCNIDERNDTLVSYICAALVVCGKYYVRSGNRARAMELFQKCVATAAGRTKFISEIVLALVEAKMAGEATQMLKRYPVELHKTPDYLLLDFQVLNFTLSPQLILQKGREVLDAGVDSERVYEIMLERASEVKNVRMMESLISKCDNKYIKLKDRFTPIYDALVKKAEPAEQPKEKA